MQNGNQATKAEGYICSCHQRGGNCKGSGCSNGQCGNGCQCNHEKETHDSKPEIVLNQ